MIAWFCLAAFLWCAPALAQDGPLSEAKDRLGKGDCKAASAAARKAVNENPGNPEAHHVLGKALAGLGRWAEAANAFREAVVKRPPGAGPAEDPTDDLCAALLHGAEEAFESGRYEDALDSLNDALVWNVDFLPAMLLRASILAEMGRTEEAEEEFGNALEKQPSHPEALYQAARFFLRAGRTADARPLLDDLMDVPVDASTRNTVFWAHLTAGRIIEEEGDKARARRRYREALALRPGDEAAKARFEALESERREAERVLRAERRLLLVSIGVLLVWAAAVSVVFRRLGKTA